jgi:hypothetical protein
MAKHSQYPSPKEHSPFLAKAVKMNETRTQKITAVSLIDALPPMLLMGWSGRSPHSSIAPPAEPHDLHSMQLPSTPLRS